MAIGERRGGDMVLGGRHLAGIFVVLVILFGAVFTLGYIMGKNQNPAQQAASAPPASAIAQKAAAVAAADKTAPTQETASPPAPDWDFYHAADPGQPAEHLVQPAKTTAAAKVPVAAAPVSSAPLHPDVALPPVRSRSTESAKKPASLNAPLIPRGAVVLQVAALARQGDALALAQALQQKKYPAFVLNPSSDHFYRVQVGPYADGQAANIARHRLESQGFKSIIKR